MKLFEIAPIKPTRFVPSEKHHTALGVGQQTIAYLHHKFPNQVVKYTWVDGSGDSVYKLTQTFMQHQDNPFFPRIYHSKLYDVNLTKEDKMKQYADVESKFMSGDKFKGKDAPYARQKMFIVVTEKLIPITNSKIAMAILHQMESWGILCSDKDHSEERIDDAAINLKFQFSRPRLRQAMREESNNPKFTEALEILEPYFQKFIADVHMHNIMARLTSTGPQLVFQDPVMNIGGQEAD